MFLSIVSSIIKTNNMKTWENDNIANKIILKK